MLVKLNTGIVGLIRVSLVIEFFGGGTFFDYFMLNKPTFETTDWSMGVDLLNETNGLQRKPHHNENVIWCLFMIPDRKDPSSRRHS